MGEQKKQSLLNGALVLSLAIVAVKLIGVFFKLYVAIKIGFEGKGYYATAYNIYTPIYSIALAGFPTAVAKMVASRAAEGKYRDVKELFSVSRTLFILTGIVGTAVILIIAYPFTKSIESLNSLPAIAAIAPSMFFCCVMSGYRGYYQGLQNMTPSAISQVIEAAGKLIFGWLLINAVLGIGVEFAGNIPVLNKFVTDPVQAYSAAAAIAGVTIGSLLALVYLILKHRFAKNLIPSELIEASPEAQNKKQLRKELIAISIPIAVSALVSNVTTLIDNWTIQDRLQHVLNTNYDTVAAMYPDVVNAFGFTPELAKNFKSYLFGAYDTVLEIKNIVPTFTITLGLSAIPVLSAAWVKGDMKEARYAIDSVYRITSLIAFPCGIGMMVLAEDILTLLYGTSATNAPAIPYIAPILMMYGVSVIFLSLTQPVTNMLQSIDRMDVPIKAMTIGAILKIVANFTLVSIPSINIQGAVYGSLICNIVMVVYGAVVIKRETGMKFDFKNIVFKPLFCALLSGGSALLVRAFYIRLFMGQDLGGVLTARNFTTLGAVMTAVIVYAFALLLTGTVKKEDVSVLPGGRKIVKLLEKCGLMG